MSKYIESVEGVKSTLEVYECICGFHIGFDVSFLAQVEDTVSVPCPSCGNPIRSLSSEDLSIVSPQK